MNMHTKPMEAAQDIVNRLQDEIDFVEQCAPAEFGFLHNDHQGTSAREVQRKHRPGTVKIVTIDRRARHHLASELYRQEMESRQE